MTMESKQKGSVLVTLLVVMAVAVIVTASALALSQINNQSISDYISGDTAYSLAESGIETGMLRMLRDRSYTGEQLSFDEGNVDILVSGTGPITIFATGKSGISIRSIEVTGDFSDNEFIISDRLEK